MQNKPNCRKGKIDAKSVFTKDYENKWHQKVRKNKPNSNPNKPNLQKAKMNINSITTKDYRKNDDFTVRINKPNSKPISEKPKMNATLYILKDYENETAFRLEQNKPNLSRRSLWRSRIQTQFRRGQSPISPISENFYYDFC